MNEYPYLAALLPTLRFADADFPSSAQFLAEAEKWLSEAEYAILVSADPDVVAVQEDTFALLAEYIRHRSSVRRDVAAFIEARRQGREHKTRAFPTVFLKDTTPLEAERRLLRHQWDYLSRQLSTHYGDLHALVIYRLQIRILERLASFAGERGAAVFADLTNTETIPREGEGNSENGAVSRPPTEP